MFDERQGIFRDDRVTKMFDELERACENGDTCTMTSLRKSGLSLKSYNINGLYRSKHPNVIRFLLAWEENVANRFKWAIREENMLVFKAGVDLGCIPDFADLRRCMSMDRDFLDLCFSIRGVNFKNVMYGSRWGFENELLQRLKIKNLLVLLSANRNCAVGKLPRDLFKVLKPFLYCYEEYLVQPVYNGRITMNEI